MATVTPRPPLVPFTPTAADPDELERRTVGRSDILDNLLDGARAAVRGLDRAHTLLVAPRGGGKTHVLAVFVHRLRTEEQLARALAVVVVAEDAVDIASYLDLLVAVVEVLGTGAQADGARELRRDGERAELERLVLVVLHGRPLVLVVENLDRVFAELGSHGQQQLRAFVETSRAVMLVASTPALFHGVSRHTEPWFGSFAVERLPPWSVDEGAAFSGARGARARRCGACQPDRLASRTCSPGCGRRTRRRAAAAVDDPRQLHHRRAARRAGAVVLATLEELVPYYQARLNELPAGERKLAVALCRAETLGSRTGRTVRDLALAAGVPEKSAPKLLSRLEEAGWVVATKPEGTDRRATWYEIREPLLRYHVVYRRQAGEPLALIVSFLRAWFSPSERRRHLSETLAGSVAESYVMETLRDAPAASDTLYASADPVDLLAGAREWFAAEGSVSAGVRSQTAAIVAEAVALVALGHTNMVETTLASRLELVAIPRRDIVRHIGRAAIDAARASTMSSSGDAPLTARQAAVQAGLDAAIGPATQGPRADEIAVALVAHGWRGARRDDEGAYRGFIRLRDRARILGGESVALRLAVEGEMAYFGCLIGKGPDELDRLRRVRRKRERLLGAEHPDTLTSRQNDAYQNGVAGGHAVARDLFAALISDGERIMGPEHPGTLSIRHSHAYQTGEAGDHAGARDLLAALVSDCERVLGPEHSDTLASRHSHAYHTGKAGDRTRASDLLTALIIDNARVLGPEHPSTLTSRAVALEFTSPRAAKRDAALSLLSRPRPPAVQSEARRALDSLFAEGASHAVDDPQQRAALPHLLSRYPGPGLLALVTRVATAPGIAPALVAATDDASKLSNLTTAIVMVLGKQRWSRSELDAWLDSWLTALFPRPSADLPRSILEVVRRETDGDQRHAHRCHPSFAALFLACESRRTTIDRPSECAARSEQTRSVRFRASLRMRTDRTDDGSRCELRRAARQPDDPACLLTARARLRWPSAPGLRA